MGDVSGKFLAPLREVYPLPKHAETNLENFFDVYVKLLRSFGDDVLDVAAQDMLANRTARSFPLPAECNAVCKHAVDTVRYGSHAKSEQGNRHEHLPFEQRYPEWEDWRIKTANELVCSEIGRQALREKWIVALHDFCRTQKRLPDKHELVNVRAKGISAQKDFEALVEKSPLNPLVGNLITLRKAMFARLGKAVEGAL